MVKVFALTGLVLASACTQQSGQTYPPVYSPPAEAPATYEWSPPIQPFRMSSPERTTCNPSFNGGFTCRTSSW